MARTQRKWRRTDCQVFNSPPQLTKSLPRTGRDPVENLIFFSCRSCARQVSRLFRTYRADRSSCFSKPQVNSLLQNCLVAKVPKVYSLRLHSAPISRNSKVFSTFGLKSSYWTRIRVGFSWTDAPPAHQKQSLISIKGMLERVRACAKELPPVPRSATTVQ